jgi:hypothetical protein
MLITGTLTGRENSLDGNNIREKKKPLIKGIFGCQKFY